MPFTDVSIEAEYGKFFMAVSGITDVGKTHLACSSVALGPVALISTLERSAGAKEFFQRAGKRMGENHYIKESIISTAFSDKDPVESNRTKAEAVWYQLEQDIEDAFTWAETQIIDSLEGLKTIAKFASWGKSEPEAGIDFESSSKPGANKTISRLSYGKLGGPNERIRLLVNKFKERRDQKPDSSSNLIIAAPAKIEYDKGKPQFHKTETDMEIKLAGSMDIIIKLQRQPVPTTTLPVDLFFEKTWLDISNRYTSIPQSPITLLPFVLAYMTGIDWEKWNGPALWEACRAEGIHTKHGLNENLSPKDISTLLEMIKEGRTE